MTSAGMQSSLSLVCTSAVKLQDFRAVVVFGGIRSAAGVPGVPVDFMARDLTCLSLPKLAKETVTRSAEELGSFSPIGVDEGLLKVVTFSHGVLRGQGVGTCCRKSD